MALKSVTEELGKLKNSQDDTTAAIKEVQQTLQAQVDMEKSKRLDDAEARLEAKKATSAATRRGGGARRLDQSRNPLGGLALFPGAGLVVPGLVAIAASITGFDDAIKALKIPDQLKSLKTALTSVKAALTIDLDDLKLPEKFKITLPEGFTKTLDGITDGLGKFVPGGGGLFGMLKGLGTFLDTIAGPALRALRFLALPLQPFLTLVDFVVGFYKGFTGKDYVYDTATGKLIETQKGIGERIMDGIEGGLLGIVKGITGAFNFLFVEIPKYLLNLFGLEGVAEILEGFNLTDMVDPIWNGIKKSFNDYFGPLENGESRLKKIFSAAYDDLVNTFKMLFDFIPSFQDLKQGFLNIMPDWFRSAFESDEAAATRGENLDNNPQVQEKMVVLDSNEMIKLRNVAARLRSGFFQIYDPKTNSFKLNETMARGFLENPKNSFYNPETGELTAKGARVINNNRIGAQREFQSIIKRIEKQGNAGLLKQFFEENRELVGALGNRLFVTNSTNNSGNTTIGGAQVYQYAPLSAGDAMPTIAGN